MANQDSYRQSISRYTGQLRYMFVEVADPGLESLAAPLDPAEILANRAEDLASASAEVGLRTVDYLNAPTVHQREGAEMKLLAQITADVEVAHSLLTAALSEQEGGSMLESMASLQTAKVQQSIEELSFVLEQPIAEGMTPFVFDGRYRDLPPMNATGAALVLERAATNSLLRISHRAARTTAQAAGTLLRMDMDTLREGVSLISQEVAELLEGIASDFRATVKRLLRAAMRLILQAFDWVLALLGQDAETIARRKVREWLDRVKGPGGGVSEDYVQRLIDHIYETELYSREIVQWIANSNADMQTLVMATEAVTDLAARYERKTEQLDKALRILGIIGILPFAFARLPQYQIALAAITMGLMGYTIFTGYDHSDSGSAYFLNRFRVPIPDRVTGVRRTVRAALSIEEPPISDGLVEPPFDPKLAENSDGATGAVEEPQAQPLNTVELPWE